MQFCDAKDASTAGLHAGDKYYWERYGDIDATDDTYLSESAPIPEGSFTYGQGSLTIREYGKSLAALFSGLRAKVMGFEMAVAA